MDNTTTNNWINRLQKVTEEVRRLCINLDHEAFNRKPDPRSWSAAQVLEHLIITHASYVPIMESVKAGTYKVSWTAYIPFFPRMIGKLILKYSKPGSKKKISTAPIWEPTTSDLPLSTVDNFISLQDRLRDFILSFAELDLKKVIIGSPLNRHFTYSLEDAFHIIVTHEERHLAQLHHVLKLQSRT